MKRIYFIAIENNEVGQTFYCKNGFNDIENAKKALQECVADYKIAHNIDSENFDEEMTEMSWYCTDNCGVHIYITINSVNIAD